MDAPAPQLSPLVIALLQGVLYRESRPELWRDMTLLQGPLRDYFTVLALDLAIDDAEGYAWLRQRETPEGEEPLPRLIRRQPLTFPVSLLCVLLRKRLMEQDAQNGEARLVMEHVQIADLLRTFLPVTANEAKRDEQIDRYIRQVEELGFLHRLKAGEEHYEVRRILRALVNADWMNDYDQRIEAYREHAQRVV